MTITDEELATAKASVIRHAVKTGAVRVREENIIFERPTVEKPNMELYRWNSPIKPLRKWGFRVSKTGSSTNSYNCFIPDNWPIGDNGDIRNSHNRKVASIDIDTDGSTILNVVTPVVFYVHYTNRATNGDRLANVVVYDRTDLDGNPIYTSDSVLVRPSTGLTPEDADKINRKNRGNLNRARKEAMDYVRATERYS